MGKMNPPRAPKIPNYPPPGEGPTKAIAAFDEVSKLVTELVSFTELDPTKAVQRVDAIIGVATLESRT